MRGGIAERGGIRVGHRIIEINGQSVVATPHNKIIQILTNAVGEVRVILFFTFLNGITLSQCHSLNLVSTLLADSLEDDASLNISALNGTRATGVSLNTSFFIQDKNTAQCSNHINFCQTHKKYYATDHTAYQKLLSHH